MQLKVLVKGPKKLVAAEVQQLILSPLPIQSECVPKCAFNKGKKILNLVHPG